jgi:hypothetical protein
LVNRLESASYCERVQAQQRIQGAEGLKAIDQALQNRRLGVLGRLHAVWIPARSSNPAAHERLFDLLKSDPEPRVQAQAMRALADLCDPVLVRHRLDAGPGDADMASRLANLAKGKDPRVVLEVVVALGRLRWIGAPQWLQANLLQPDPALSHAVMQALRRSGNWPAVLQLLDLPETEPMHAIALRALADQAVPGVVDGLIDRLRRERVPSRRAELADALTRVYKRPAPWVYWGFRPAPRLANSVSWERTEAIAQALDRALADPERAVRLKVLRRMQREKVPASLPTLVRWLDEEKEPEPLGAILEAMSDHPAASIRQPLLAAVTTRAKPASLRVKALTLMAGGLDEATEHRLLDLAGSLEDGPVLVEALHQLSKRPRLKANALILGKLDSSDPTVRAAALEGLAEAPPENVLRKLLQDPNFFCTCDDKILKKAKRLKGLATQVVSPLQLIAEVTP